MSSQSGRLAAALLSPTILVLLLVIAYPIFAAIHESLYVPSTALNANGFIIQGDQFVGLANYSAIFTGDAGRFWNAVSNTTFFTVVCVSIETVIGLAMALVMNQALRGKGLIRASILVPWAIPTVVAAQVWAWIFNVNGIANVLLPQQILWSADTPAAKVAVIIADTWKTAPFIGLMVLAGLQIIPEELYEAAKMDGASALNRFWRVTLPLVKPAVLVAVLFRLLDTLRMFDMPYVLIGPLKGNVETLSMLAYNENLSSRYGSAAAYAVILFLYVAVIAFLFVKLLGADVMRGARPKTPDRVKDDRGSVGKGGTW